MPLGYVRRWMPEMPGASDFCKMHTQLIITTAGNAQNAPSLEKKKRLINGLKSIDTPIRELNTLIGSADKIDNIPDMNKRITSIITLTKTIKCNY